MTRRTNLALAAVLAVATASGVAALLVGEGRAAVVVWAHGAAGFALLALMRPKSRIALVLLHRSTLDREGSGHYDARRVVQLGSGSISRNDPTPANDLSPCSRLTPPGLSGEPCRSWMAAAPSSAFARMVR